MRVVGAEGRLYINGHHPLYIKGVLWRGSETGPKPPNGLNYHPLEWYFDFLKTNGFNAVRLPFNHRDVLDNPPLDLTGAKLADPSWMDLDYLGMIKQFAAKAAAKGILVLPVADRLDREPLPDTEGGGLWYSADFSEKEIIDSWRKLSTLLCANDWNVFGVDLMSEPVCRRACLPFPFMRTSSASLMACSHMRLLLHPSSCAAPSMLLHGARALPRTGTSLRHASETRYLKCARTG